MYFDVLELYKESILSLYNISSLTFNSQDIPFKVISKQAAVVVFHSHLSLFFGADNFTLFTSDLTFLAPRLCIGCYPFINNQFRIDSFLDWEGHRWVFISHRQTIASDSLINQLIVIR